MGFGSETGGSCEEKISSFCGDSRREPTLEECDDGPGETADVCSSDCRVQEAWLASTPSDRSWDRGAHVFAATDTQVAATYLALDSFQVHVARFDAVGTPLGPPLDVSGGAEPSLTPAPALAALPGGRFVVAFTDTYGFSPDIVMRTIPGARLHSLLVPKLQRLEQNSRAVETSTQTPLQLSSASSVPQDRPSLVSRGPT